MNTVNIKKIGQMPNEPHGVCKWRVKFKFTTPTDPSGTTPHPFRRFFVGTLEQARQYRDHYKYHLKAGRNPDDYPLPWEDGESRPQERIRDGEHAYEQLWNEYKRWRQGAIDAGRSTITPESWWLEQHVMETHVVPTLDHLIVERTDARDLEDVLNRWGRERLRKPGEKKLKRHRRAGTLNTWLNYLRCFLGWVSDELQIYDPSGRLRGFRDLVSDDDHEKPALSPEEVYHLLSVIREKKPRIWGISAVSFFGGGLRWKIPSALKWDDVDEEAGVIRIERQQTKGRIRPVEDLERKGCPHALPLSKFADILDDHRAWMEDVEHPGRTSEFVFPCWADPMSTKCEGMWAHNTSYNKWLAEACQEAGVPRISHHGWRRSWNSIALEHSVENETVVRRATGHVTQQMTDLYYRQSAAKIEDIIGSVQEAVEHSAETDDDTTAAAE